MPSSQPLPPKEKTLFNRILKCYEQKQYKNGLKFAKQILSNPKFADHGETLAMKGLTLNCTGKKEEAYELVKKGLKNDLKSHVCWHVYGLLQRSDKKYDEAIKCYRNALRWDKENLHILRDLSMLQVHMRDLEGYRETRYTLLQLKPGQRASWIGYAIANHLLKDYMVAFKVLEEFGKTQQSQDNQYEHSELLLYQTDILVEAGLHQRALEHLEGNKDRIVDKLTWLETKGDLFIKLQNLDEAEEIFTDLVYRNPENHRYLKKLEEIVNPSTLEERLQLYQSVTTVFPKADSPKFIPVTFSTGSTFQNLIDKFMRSQLKRGVPPLFTSLKPLYSDPEKVRFITATVESYISSLESCEKFSEADEETEPPTTILWTKYFYALHLDALKEYEKALSVLNQSLEHTPTLIELHVAKAKVLKHLGDIAGAVACMDEAQSLDTADRFINCKCACYMIRNDMISEAEETASKFTRENISVEEYLKEMQCMWYEVECANAHTRAKRFGEALQKCHEVDRHFSEIVEDQFDFHQYCMRKMTLRSYVKMLKLEDSLRSHRFYFEAARIAIKVYINLHDEPYKPGDRKTIEGESSMSSAELKKLRNKQRRQERKKAAQEEKRKQEEKANRKKQQQQRKNDDEGDTKKEEEFQPEKLVSVSDPLDQAQKFLVPLELHCYNRFDTHMFAFQIAERRSRLLVMLRALLRAQKAASNGDLAELHFCKVRFAKKVCDTNGVSSAVNDVIGKHFGNIYGDVGLEEFNQRFLDENNDSLAHIYAGSKAMYHLDNAKKDEALLKLLNFSTETKNVTIQICEDILTSLRSKLVYGQVPEDFLKDFTEKCRDFFPRACSFKPPGSTVTAKVNGIDHCSAGDPTNTGDIAMAEISMESSKADEHKMNADQNYDTSETIENHCSNGM
ncbi:unnamed protein product [Clavelina lepadiformis]|uniref:Uncharacterized protein n=1 Tax=Clavelina lepadiformis TaxID=159417 RepID=A0ABP0H0I0_CLALP